jgi:hypothetical protein
LGPGSLALLGLRGNFDSLVDERLCGLAHQRQEFAREALLTPGDNVTEHTEHGELRFSQCGASIRASPESESLAA